MLEKSKPRVNGEYAKAPAGPRLFYFRCIMPCQTRLTMMDRIDFGTIVIVLLFIVYEVSSVKRSLKEIEGKLDAILKAK